MSNGECEGHTFIVSPSENGFENCIDKPLSTFPRMSRAAKAVATPAYKIRRDQSKLLGQYFCRDKTSFIFIKLQPKSGEQYKNKNKFTNINCYMHY